MRSSPPAPLVVFTSGRQPLLRRALCGAAPPVWVVGPAEVATQAARDGHRGLEVPAGSGFAAMANAALARADDEGLDAVVLLNDDAQLLAGAREGLLAAVRRPGIAAAGALLLHDDGRGVQAAGLDVRLGGGRVVARRRAPAGPVAVAALPATALALRVAPVRAVGGFDGARFPFYFEDVELGVRLRAAGYRLVLVPSARALHRGAATAGRGSAFTAYHGARGQLALARGPGARRITPALLAAALQLASLARRGEASRAARARATLRGIAAGWRGCSPAGALAQRPDPDQPAP